LSAKNQLYVNILENLKQISSSLKRKKLDEISIKKKWPSANEQEIRQFL